MARNRFVIRVVISSICLNDTGQLFFAAAVVGNYGIGYCLRYTRPDLVMGTSPLHIYLFNTFFYFVFI